MADNVATTSKFNPTFTEIATYAFRDLDIITGSETPTAAMFDEALFKMNSVVKSMEATGIHVWTEEEAILFLQPLQARYQIGRSSVGAVSALNAHTADAYQWIQSSLSQSYSTAATVLALSTLVGANGSNIGIVLATGATFWTTVASGGGTAAVTIADALPSAASAAAVVANYPAAGDIARPLKVPKARLLTFTAANTAQGPQEIPMTILARSDYMDLPNKLSQGTPTQIFYDPQRDAGYLFVWPVPTLCNWAVRFTWYRPLADILTASNTLDFPQEWITPLRWLLADELKLGYSVPAARAQMVEKKAAEWLDIVASWDRETQDIQFGLDFLNR